MPLYEYQCLACEKVHEIIQKFSDAPLQNCPDCQQPVQKILSMSSFSLKGTGWYVTDYKKSSKKPSTPTPAEAKETPPGAPAVTTPPAAAAAASTSAPKA